MNALVTLILTLSYACVLSYTGFSKDTQGILIMVFLFGLYITLELQDIKNQNKP